MSADDKQQDQQQPLLWQQQRKDGDDDGESSITHSSHVDGCPGCELEMRKLTTKGPPTKELFFVAVMVLCNALPISSLFPFIYFMVEDFHITNSVTEVAFYAGFIGSAFMAGRFLSSTPWGLIADKYGRKPVMICGTASVLVFNSLFGFSTTFWMALLSRFLLGLFNGLLGTIRAYVSEICREEQQAFGMSMVGTVWGLGLVIGPAIGGYLAQPSSKYPSIFLSGSIFDQFPYALPCLCISSFAALSLGLSFSVPESLHKHSAAINSKSIKDPFGKLPPTNPLSKNWGFISAVMLYCIWSLHDMAYTEIFSLWAVSPTTLWGLELTTSDVGIVLAISGGVLLFFQMLLYPIAQKRLGPIQTCRLSAILSVPLIAVYPLIAWLHGSSLWTILIVASCLKNVLSVSVMTASFILINHAVTSDQRGMANGVSMSFMSLFKAVGPATAGSLLSWAETRLDASFLPGTWMVFSILALFCFFTIVVTIEPILPQSLDHPKPELSRVQSLTLQRQASFSV